MKYALSIMFILVLPVVAVSEWIVISLESAVKSSDIIVIGTLRDVSEETRDNIDLEQAKLPLLKFCGGR